MLLTNVNPNLNQNFLAVYTVSLFVSPEYLYFDPVAITLTGLAGLPLAGARSLLTLASRAIEVSVELEEWRPGPPGLVTTSLT